MSKLDSLMSGGYEPDIDDVKTGYVPDIDCQYVACWNDNGEVRKEVFTVFDGDDEMWHVHVLTEFAKQYDVILCYREPDGAYINPKTGEVVRTPHLGEGPDHYTLQNRCPWHKAEFTPMTEEELDELFESSWSDQYESTL